MAETQQTMTASKDSELLIHTGVTGKASKMGHRLTIAVSRWRAVIDWAGDEPAAVELVAEVASIDVQHGEGGVTPLLGPEKMLAKSNALKTFDAKQFPTIRFVASTVEAIADGYRLAGTLEIHGTVRDHSVDVRVDGDDDRHRLSAQSTVRQSDFGIKPYSQLMGAMKVVDDVTVAFGATISAPGR